MQSLGITFFSVIFALQSSSLATGELEMPYTSIETPEKYSGDKGLHRWINDHYITLTFFTLTVQTLNQRRGKQIYRKGPSQMQCQQHILKIVIFTTNQTMAQFILDNILEYYKVFLYTQNTKFIYSLNASESCGNCVMHYYRKHGGSHAVTHSHKVVDPPGGPYFTENADACPLMCPSSSCCFIQIIMWSILDLHDKVRVHPGLSQSSGPF